VTVNVRNPTPDDAAMYENIFSDAVGRSPESMNMILIPAMGMEGSSSWVRFTSFVTRRRFQRWPQGKVAEADFHLLEGQVLPAEGQRNPAEGLVLGLTLAMETVLTGVQMDPKTVVYGTIDQDDPNKITRAFGYMSQAVDAAREGGYRLMVVSDEMESVTRDWLAFGDLDRLMDPQLVMASNIDELVYAVRSDRPAKVEEAIELFAEIKEIKMTLEEASRNAVVQQRLQAIIDQFPQHLSAKMLLAYGKAGDGLKASLSGSVTAIREVLQPFVELYSNSMSEDLGDSKKRKELSDQAKDRLNHLRTRVDDEVQDYLSMSEKTLAAFASFLSLSSKTSSTAMKRRGKVEDALLELNEENGRLRDILDEERR